MIWLVQLVFDCADPDVVTQFWGQALEYRHPLVGAPAEEVRAFRAQHPQFDGRGRIDDGELRRMPVYLQRVPEPKTGRNRLRPEVVADRARLLDLGATEHGEDLRDPEGNELTVVRDDGPVRLRSITIDALDPERQLDFWAQATGYVPTSALRCDPAPVHHELTWTGAHFERSGSGPLRHITGTAAAGDRDRPAPYDLVPGLAFVEADGPKRTKNRLHLDLHSTDATADRRRLEALGAEVVQWDTDHVLVDPDGNELCLSGPVQPG